MSYSVQIPDFAGTLARGEQMQMSRLQAMAQQQAMDDAQKYRAVSADVLPQLGTAEGPTRMSLLSRLAGSGMQGAQLALPMLNQERERAQFQQMLSGALGGGMPAAPAGPTAPPAFTTTTQRPGGPISGPNAGGGDVRALNEEAARRREAAMALPPDQQPAALAAVSEWRAAAGGTPARPGGYRANEGVDGAFRGLPAPSGVVPPVAPGGAPQPAAGAPRGLPSPQALFAMAASGNPRAVEFVRTVAPLVARESPNFTITDVGGRRVAVNPQNPRQTIDLGPSEAPDRTLVERRNADGSVTFVPRPEAAGMTSAAPPRDDFNRANTLRDEFRTLTSEYRIIRDAFSNIETASRSQTGAGDMSMLYSFVKLLDPNSVVRESEFAAAAASGSLGERMQGAVQRILSGERLPDSLRDAFLTEARNIYQTQTRTYQQTERTYRDLAQRNNLDPANVVLPFAPAAAPAPATGGAAQGIPGPGGVGTAEPPRAPPPMPQRGEVRDGYRFRGGNPADRNSWERVR